MLPLLTYLAVWETEGLDVTGWMDDLRQNIKLLLRAVGHDRLGRSEGLVHHREAGVLGSYKGGNTE